MRMSELAQVAFSSRSRLSHQIDRMQKAGYVTREVPRRPAGLLRGADRQRPRGAGRSRSGARGRVSAGASWTS